MQPRTEPIALSVSTSSFKLVFVNSADANEYRPSEPIRLPCEKRELNKRNNVHKALHGAVQGESERVRNRSGAAKRTVKSKWPRAHSGNASTCAIASAASGPSAPNERVNFCADTGDYA